ncbi:MAG: polysaccharide deacetylase family protein [Candidatus Heimdallarchaeota archaeon]|nr:polysaccharide deacetylase family protein [Candidatus Heimdallarchaeota archaeon]
MKDKHLEKIMWFSEKFGLNKLAYNKRLKNNHTNLFVLCYHETSQERFRENILHLEKKYRLISLDEFCKKLVRKDFPNDIEVAITFDDGRKNFIQEIFPVAEELGIYITHYIATGFTDSKKLFWWDFISQLRKNGVIINSNKFSYTNNIERDSLYTKYQKELKLEKLDNALSSAELKQLSKSKYIEIGAHTVTHPNLTLLSREEAISEIKESKEFLENLLKKEIQHFAYPYGYYNELILEITKSLGFKSAATVENQWLSLSDTIYDFPRIGTAVYGASINWLKAKIAGTFDSIKKKINYKT